jgi:hypothetical protein
MISELIESSRLHNNIYTGYNFPDHRATTIYSGAGNLQGIEEYDWISK